MRLLTPRLLLLAVALLVRNTFLKSPAVNEQSHLLVATAISALTHVTISRTSSCPRLSRPRPGESRFWPVTLSSGGRTPTRSA